MLSDTEKFINLFILVQFTGTPIQIQRTGKAACSKSFGDSIKRHIFNKGLLNKTPKKGSGSSINVIEEVRTVLILVVLQITVPW